MPGVQHRRLRFVHVEHGQEPWAQILEVQPRYSDEPNDLSNLLSYSVFKDKYAACIAQALTLLRPKHFACFVVGEVTDQSTRETHDIPADTTNAFLAAGAKKFTTGILTTPAGTAAPRAARTAAGCKLVKTHQTVAVYAKRRIPTTAETREFGIIMKQFEGEAQ